MRILKHRFEAFINASSLTKKQSYSTNNFSSTHKSIFEITSINLNLLKFCVYLFNSLICSWLKLMSIPLEF